DAAQRYDPERDAWPVVRSVRDRAGRRRQHLRAVASHRREGDPSAGGAKTAAHERRGEAEMRTLLLLVCGALPLAAQVRPPGSPMLGAESGMYAESYSITDRPSRRPPQSVRFFASPTFSWMGLEVGSNLMWSTEDQFAAQTLNRYYLNPRWSWGQVHAGDYSPMISRLTASAVRVRGGGVELTPGRFRIAASGGLAQDATDASVFDAAPRRVMYAGLVG